MQLDHYNWDGVTLRSSFARAWDSFSHKDASTQEGLNKTQATTPARRDAHFDTEARDGTSPTPHRTKYGKSLNSTGTLTTPARSWNSHFIYKILECLWSGQVLLLADVRCQIPTTDPFVPEEGCHEDGARRRFQRPEQRPTALMMAKAASLRSRENHMPHVVMMATRKSFQGNMACWLSLANFWGTDWPFEPLATFISCVRQVCPGSRYLGADGR
mmetsp:Transcript_104328/g.336276  ORF Transcript_104328/g.336276 Transcript_104328/m.336276 type:complete len:215 (-) Transcript_104328:479-1123(-)